MKIAVAGSEGFIGKHLCAAMNELADVELLPLDIVNGFDLTLDAILDAVPPFDVFIYLAGMSFVPDSFKHPKRFYETNFSLTLNALELCKKRNARFICTSSYVYGSPQYLPVDENHPVAANNPYIQTKIISEQLCHGYYRDFDVKCTIIRPFNIFGPGQTGGFLIPSIIEQLRQGTGSIRLIDPLPRRDFVYVTDLCDAYIKAALSDDAACETFNVASGQSFSVLEITEMLLEETGRTEVKVTFNQAERRKNEVMEVCGSYEKIRQRYGWEPGIGMREGLKLVVRSELH